MLYRVEIENFYSFKDLQVIDLQVPRNVREFPERFAPIFPGSGIRAPKVVAVFGPNGSGKSNFLRSLSFMAWFLLESFKQNPAAMFCEIFNSPETSSRPIRLAVELGGNLNLADPAGQPTYGLLRYEVELSAENYNVRTVRKEALRQKVNGVGKWARVFERVDGQPLQGSKTFPLSGYSQVIDKIRPNASVIATLALFAHPSAVTITEALKKVTTNILMDRIEISDQQATQELVSNPELLAALNRDLQRIDLGIDKVEVTQTPGGARPIFKHHGLGLDMPWTMESHGTRSFIKQFRFLFFALQNGGIAILDEMDSLIHPMVLPEILRWFYDPERNPGNAQLWTSSQSVSLLEELLKEEVVFCEKDRHGGSRCFSLMDVQALRRNENLYKKYMGGAYGAVPQIG